MAWKDLSIAQRSQLMNLMRHNGISSLSEMRRLYDLSSPSSSSLGENTFNMRPQAPVYAKGGDKKNTISDKEIMEGTSEKAIYIRRLIQYAMNNPSGLWADTKDAAKAREWLRNNAPKQLSSLYHSLDDNFKKTVDKRFIPTDAKEYDYQQGIRDYRDNEGVKFTLGASAIPLSTMGIAEAALAVPQAASWLSQGKNLAKLGRIGYNVAGTELLDRLPAYITDNNENRISKIGGKGLENAFRWVMPESKFTESVAPYVNSAGRLATFLGEGAVTDLIGKGSMALADNAAYTLYKAKKLKTDPIWQARDAAKRQGILYHINNPKVGVEPKSGVPFVFKDGKWRVDTDKVWSGSLKTDFLKKRQLAKRAMEDEADAFGEQLSKKADQIKDEIGRRAESNLYEFRENAGYAPSDDPKGQVQWVLNQVKAGKRPPLSTKVTDMFGKEVEIPEEFAAAMQTPHFNTVYPNGVDFWWRGFDSRALSSGTNWYDAPTRYPSIFGGEYNMAKGYTGGFSGPVPDEDIILSTKESVPNLMLLMTPKGQFKNLGEFAGGYWAQLPNTSSKEVVEAQRELSKMFEMAKANPSYAWDYARKMELESIIRQNPLKIPELHPTHKYSSTDDIATDLDMLTKSEVFPESGVILKDVSDGPRGIEVIYNPRRGGYPKVVSPLSTYKFDLLERSYLKDGGKKKETAYARKYREEQEAKAKRALEHPTLSNAFRDDISSETGDKYYDVINARYHQSMDALRRKGFTFEDALRLAPLMVTQNIVEGGWRVARPDDNNFGGLRENGRFLKFDSPEEYYDNYLDLLDRKWGASRGSMNNWRTAQNLDDWSRILNREDLNLWSKERYDDYNREHRDNPVYLYAPEWENSYKSYRQHLAGVEPRVNTYLDMVLEENPYTKEMYNTPIEPVIQPNDRFNLSMDQFQKLLESNREDFAKGGHKIHIKKENRGKFTALKKRTGHSASWFKAHGTPAQKKMAIFALNSKKWHKKSRGGIKF